MDRPLLEETEWAIIEDSVQVALDCVPDNMPMEEDEVSLVQGQLESIVNRIVHNRERLARTRRLRIRNRFWLYITLTQHPYLIKCRHHEPQEEEPCILGYPCI